MWTGFPQELSQPIFSPGQHGVKLFPQCRRGHILNLRPKTLFDKKPAPVRADAVALGTEANVIVPVETVPGHPLAMQGCQTSGQASPVLLCRRHRIDPGYGEALLVHIKDLDHPQIFTIGVTTQDIEALGLFDQGIPKRCVVALDVPGVADQRFFTASAIPNMGPFSIAFSSSLASMRSSALSIQSSHWSRSLAPMA